MSTTKLRPPFARNLRHCMTERRMTQQDLATRMNVSLRAVAAWCVGENIPHPRTIGQLSSIFGRSPEWFRQENDL